MSAAASGPMKADDLGSTYDGEFFDELDGQVRVRARVIAPMIVDLLRPSSILDVGCGRGTWLHASPTSACMTSSASTVPTSPRRIPQFRPRGSSPEICASPSTSGAPSIW